MSLLCPVSLVRVSSLMCLSEVACLPTFLHFTRPNVTSLVNLKLALKGSVKTLKNEVFSASNRCGFAVLVYKVDLAAILNCDLRDAPVWRCVMWDVRFFSPKHVLGTIGYVKEAIWISVLWINLSHAGWQTGHVLSWDQEVKSLRSLQHYLTSERERGSESGHQCYSLSWTWSYK